MGSKLADKVLSTLYNNNHIGQLDFRSDGHCNKCIMINLSVSSALKFAIVFIDQQTRGTNLHGPEVPLYIQ